MIAPPHHILNYIMLPLVLASSSKARIAILNKLKYPFTSIAPNIDEMVLPGEIPAEHVLRLAREKAFAVSAQCDRNALIVACDSVCVFEGEIVSKPETVENARMQLARASGKEIYFYTGLCLLNNATQKFHSVVDQILVEYRPLSAAMIENYIALDQPLDCAGSIRAEGLGIALIKRFSVSDPNSLVGLPLIQLIDFLNIEGLDVLNS